MKRLIVAALALSACTEPGQVAPPASPVTQTPAEAALSDGASKIVTVMRVRPDIATICSGGQAFHDAMRESVIKLMMVGELVGDPRSDAESAAAYLMAHCGKSDAAPADMVGPSPAAK